MLNFILENDDKIEEQSNVADPKETVEETTEVAGTEQPEKTQTEQPSTETATEEETQEPTIEIDGEQVPVSKVKQWKEEYAQDSKWKDKNRRESEALNQQKREYDSLKLLVPALQQRPDILQELLQPKRDIDAEVQAHYRRKPDPYADPQNSAAWEYQKDQLLLEQAAQRQNTIAMQHLAQEEAKRNNDDLFGRGVEKFLEAKKVDVGEFQDMQRWILENVKDARGKYPMNAFDIAYAALYGDRKVRSEKVEAVKTVLKSQAAAKPATEHGTQKVQSDNELSESDAAFVSTMHAKTNRKRTLE